MQPRARTARANRVAGATREESGLVAGAAHEESGFVAEATPEEPGILAIGGAPAKAPENEEGRRCRRPSLARWYRVGTDY